MSSLDPLQSVPQQGEDNESQEQKDQYNPLASPPNLTKALRHGNATRIGKMDAADLDSQKMDYCECCGLTLNHRPVPVCGSRLDLHDLGAGFPLYFEYVFFGGILLFIMFLIVGIWGLISSYKSIQCSLFENNTTYPCKGGFIIEYSMGNKGPADEYRINSILNLVFVVVGILMAFYYRRVQAMTADEVDRGAITNSDYTVMVSGIPKTESEDQIKEFFQKKGKYGKEETTVKKVNLAYEIGPFVELVRKRDALAASIAKGKASEKAKQELHGLEKQITAFEEAIDNKTSNKFTGIAFITFNTERDTMEVVRKFQMGPIQKMLYNSLRYFLSCVGVTLEKTYKGTIIRLGKAPDPLDVFWENLGHDWWKVMRTRLFSLLSTVILIGMSFGIILGISFGQQSAKKNNANNGTLISFLAFLGSYVIVIINGLIGFFMRKLAGLEKHTTYTYYFISIANKLTYAQFFNTALITLFVQLVRSEGIQLWVQDSIVSKVFFLFLLNAFVPSLTYLFNPGYLYKLYQRSRMISEGSKCKLTQAEANKLFEGPQVDIAQRYANVQKTLLFTAFYANLVPIGIVFSFVGLFITYWTDKWILLRRHTRPQVLGKELAEEMTDFLELFFVAFASGNLIFEKIARDEVSALNIVAAALAVAAFLLPQQLLAGCIRKADGEIQNGEHYDQARFRFVTEYDRVNPVTKEDATDEWMMELSKKMESQGGEKGPSLGPAAYFQHMPRQNASSNLTSYAQYNPSFQQVHQMNNGNFNMAFAPRAQPMVFAPVQFRPQAPTPMQAMPQNRALVFPPQMARYANQQLNRFVPIQMQNAFGFNQPRPVVANHFPQQNPQPIAIQMAQVKPPMVNHFPQAQPQMPPQMQQQPPMNPPPVANHFPQPQQQPPMNPPPVANHFPQAQPQMQQQPQMMNQPQPIMAQPQPIMARPQPQPQTFQPMMPMGQPSMMQQQPPANIHMVQQVQPNPFGGQPQAQFGFQQPQPQFGFQQPQPQFGMQQPNMQMNFNNQQPRVNNTVFGGQPGFGFRNQGF